MFNLTWIYLIFQILIFCYLIRIEIRLVMIYYRFLGLDI